MKLVRLKDPLDSHHKARADRHGYMYFAKDSVVPDLLIATSVATGVICNLWKYSVEEAADAERLQEGS